MTARAVVVLAAGLLIAVILPAQENDKQELERLQGEWAMVSQESKGAKTPDAYVKESKLTIKGDAWTARNRDQISQLTFKIDASKEPKTIDRTLAASGTVLVGIYRLEGDMLTICSGGVRPKEFKTTEEGGLLSVYKRANK